MAGLSDGRAYTRRKHWTFINMQRHQIPDPKAERVLDSLAGSTRVLNPS